MSPPTSRRKGASSSEAEKAESTPGKKTVWTYVARRTIREFSSDQCTDLAAALTYYGVLALFPAMIAVLSLVGLIGQGPKTVTTLVSILSDIGAKSAASTLEPTLRQLSNTTGAGFAFVLGLLLALWSASGYVGAFSRAMNRIYKVEEGRPFLKLRLMMVVVTVITVVLAALIAVALILTGPAASSVGDAIGVGSNAVRVWNIAKWPVLLASVVLLVGLLYFATPNVQQPKFRWMSVGAVLAIVVWVLASLAFGFYVANFASYNKTYGSLAGVIVFLLWLWLTNLALLFGAELDAELERERQLRAGVQAEESLQLPPRDTQKIDKAAEKRDEDVEEARRLRTGQSEDGSSNERA